MLCGGGQSGVKGQINCSAFEIQEALEERAAGRAGAFEKINNQFLL